MRQLYSDQYVQSRLPNLYMVNWIVCADTVEKDIDEINDNNPGIHEAHKSDMQM